MNERLSRIRIVLCRPSHPGNIGAAARAMKAMGLADLRLVAPRRFRTPDARAELIAAPQARAMASAAVDVLEAARLHDTLPEALADCVAAFALSARPREHSPRAIAAREAAALALERSGGGPVAFVFGSEAAGLTNEELFACQHLVHIPADAASRSLNLAQAVQIVAYELHVAALGGVVPQPPREMPATLADLEGLYAHLDEAGVASGFLDPDEPKRLRERWRRLFSRAALEREEVNILRGLLRALLRDKLRNNRDQ